MPRGDSGDTPSMPCREMYWGIHFFLKDIGPVAAVAVPNYEATATVNGRNPLVRNLFASMLASCT